MRRSIPKAAVLDARRWNELWRARAGRWPARISARAIRRWPPSVRSIGHTAGITQAPVSMWHAQHLAGILERKPIVKRVSGAHHLLDISNSWHT